VSFMGALYGGGAKDLVEPCSRASESGRLVNGVQTTRCVLTNAVSRRSSKSATSEPRRLTLDPGLLPHPFYSCPRRGFVTPARSAEYDFRQLVADVLRKTLLPPACEEE
jgi:hypothetical protein